MTENSVSIECNLGGVQNGYLGLILPPKQYVRVSGTAFVLTNDPSRTAHVPAWTLLTEEKRVLQEHTEQRRLYDKYRTVNSYLKNQLLTVFDNPFLYTINDEYTRYATRSTLDLIKHLYE